MPPMSTPALVVVVVVVFLDRWHPLFDQLSTEPGGSVRHTSYGPEEEHLSVCLL